MICRNSSCGAANVLHIPFGARPVDDTPGVLSTHRRLALIAILCALVGASGVLGQATAPPTGAPAPSTRATGPVALGEANSVKVYALRLGPGQDLRAELEQFTKAKRIRAGFIVTVVGSLDGATLRLADQSTSAHFNGKFEIVSLVGTLSPDGPHLHISLSDNTGKTIGGHLVEGCRIYTTAEIVVGEARGLTFHRSTDAVTTYPELTIGPSSRSRRRRH